MSLKSFSIAIFAGIALLLSACSSENSTSTSEEILDESSASKDNSSESKDPSANSSSSVVSSSNSTEESGEAFDTTAVRILIEDALANAYIEGCESIDTTEDEWYISFSTSIGIIPYIVDITYDFSTTPAKKTTELLSETFIEPIYGTKAEEFATASKTCKALSDAIESGDATTIIADKDVLQFLSEFVDFSDISQIPLLTNQPDLGLLPEYPQEYPNKD